MFVNGNETADSDTLAAIEIPPGTSLGTKVFNVDVGSDFILTLSDAALDPDVIVAVAGYDGLRWIVNSTSATVTTDATLDGDGSSGDPLTVVSAPTADAPTDAATFTAALNAATSSASGLMTAAQYKKITDLDFDGWLTTQVELMKAQAPALTNFKELPLNLLATSVPNASWSPADGVQIGGSITSASGKAVPISNSTVWQTPATTSWAFAVRGKLVTSTAGKVNFFGMMDASIDKLAGVATYSVGDATHYLIYTSTSPGEEVQVSTLVCDDAIHDFVVTFDGTSIKLYVDGTLRATETTLTQLADAAHYFAAFNTTSPEAIVLRAAIGYIDP